MTEDLRYSDMVELRGLAAEGCADRWRKSTERVMSEEAAKLHPDARDGFRERASAWISGKYENLKRHERREVRAGKLERLQKDNAEDANREAFDVLKQSEGVDRAYAADLARIKATRAELGKDEAWEKGEAEKLAKGRAVDFSNLVMQIGATSLDGGDRIAGAVAEGLIDGETGKAMERAHRRGVVATTLKTLLEGGKADQAEGFLGVLEADDAKVALELGFTPDALEQVRGKIAAVRERKAAEAEKAKALETKAVLDAYREEDAKERLKYAGGPGTVEDLASQSVLDSLRYARYAQDERLPATERERYRELSESVKAAGVKLLDEDRERREKAEGAAEKSRVESFKEAMLVKEGEIEFLRDQGEDGNRRANEMEGELFAAVSRAFAKGEMPAKDYIDYRKRRAVQLTADERRAMMRFDRAIGLGVEVDAGGEAKNAASMKGKVELKDERKFKADDVLKYRQRLLAELRRLGKDVSREEVVSRVIDQIAADAFEKKFSEETAADVVAALEAAQNEVRAATAAPAGASALPTGKREDQAK